MDERIGEVEYIGNEVRSGAYAGKYFGVCHIWKGRLTYHYDGHLGKLLQRVRRPTLSFRQRYLTYRSERSTKDPHDQAVITNQIIGHFVSIFGLRNYEPL